MSGEPGDPDGGSPSVDADAAMREPTYAIGDLADEFKITARTMRFYEARGLISPSRIGANRLYSRRDRARLMLILRGKNLGFTLEDIGEYLELYDADPSQRAQTELLLGKIEAMVVHLETKRRDLDSTLAELGDLQARCLSHLKE